MKYFRWSLYLFAIIYNQVTYQYSLFSTVDSFQQQSTAKDFANFLQNYQHFHIIFHTDSRSVHFANAVISLLNAPEDFSKLLLSIEVYNYDTLNTPFIRSNVSHAVDVLMVNNTNIWSSLGTPSKVISNDVIIFFGRHLQETIRKDGLEILKLAGHVILYELSNVSDIYNVYSTCYYCGYQSTQFKLLLNSTTNNTIDPNHVLPLTMLNLKGHLLHTVFIQYRPFVYCNDKELEQTIVNGEQVLACNDVGGIESNLLQTLSEKLNFTYLVHTLNISSSFFDMIMHVNAGRADISFGGVSMSEERIPFVQFSKMYNFEGYVFLYVLKWPFAEIFATFMERFRAVDVWILYIISFLVLSLLVYIIRRIKKHDSKERNSFRTALWTMLHMPFEQSVHAIDRIITINPSIFIVMTLWWWSCMIISTLFKSSMLSAMVLPPNTEPEDLEQLILAGYRFAGNLQYADIIKELLHVNDPMYREAYEKTIYAEDACGTLEKILVGGVALLDELSEIQYDMRYICPVPDDSIISRFRTTRKIIRFTGHAWGLQMGAPFRQALDYYLSLILSGGLFKKWTCDETRRLEAYQIPKSRSINRGEATGLSFLRLTPVLVVYSIGILSAVVCFLTELVVFHIQRRLSRTNGHWKF